MPGLIGFSGTGSSCRLRSSSGRLSRHPRAERSVKSIVKVVLLVALCALIVSATVRADERQDRQWNDVKTALKRGAYREALESVDVILAVSPNDSRASLYRSLCEKRLAAPQQFASISPAQLSALRQQLRLEERTQRRTTAQQHALERQLQKEQARWDRELETIHRQAQRNEKLTVQREQAQALERARAEQALAREHAQARAVAQEQVVARPHVAQVPSKPPQPPPTTIPESAPTRQSPPSLPLPSALVELAPIIVPTAPSVSTEKVPAQSSSGPRRPPPGAVEINARQMSVSPDRKLAIAEGDVEVIFENAVLTADHLTLFTDTNDVYAEGRVRLEDGSQVFRGEMG